MHSTARGLGLKKERYEHKEVWEPITAEVDQKSTRDLFQGQGECEHEENWVLFYLVHLLIHFKGSGFGSFKDDSSVKTPSVPDLVNWHEDVFSIKTT